MSLTALVIIKGIISSIFYCHFILQNLSRCKALIQLAVGSTSYPSGALWLTKFCTWISSKFNLTRKISQHIWQNNLFYFPQSICLVCNSAWFFFFIYRSVELTQVYPQNQHTILMKLILTLFLYSTTYKSVVTDPFCCSVFFLLHLQGCTHYS